MGDSGRRTEEALTALVSEIKKKEKAPAGLPGGGGMGGMY